MKILSRVLHRTILELGAWSIFIFDREPGKECWQHTLQVAKKGVGVHMDLSKEEFGWAMVFCLSRRCLQLLLQKDKITTLETNERTNE